MGKICLNGEEYGNEVIANPQGSPTETLNTIQIGDIVYELPSGGGSNITQSNYTHMSSPSIVETRVTVEKES